MGRSEFSFVAVPFVGLINGRGMVRIQMAEADVTVNADNARKLAYALLSAAEAALHDQALGEYFLAETGFSREDALHMLKRQRERREVLDPIHICEAGWSIDTPEDVLRRLGAGGKVDA